MDNASTIEQTFPDCEIVASRIVKAPQNLVFKAWTDPEHLINWWGPKGFTNTFYQHDPRPKGVWSFAMIGPDGTKFPNECVFVDVNASEYISWDHLSSPRFQVRVHFEAIEPRKTKVTFRMVFETEEECRKVAAFAGTKNEENLDRLEAELGKMA